MKTARWATSALIAAALTLGIAGCAGNTPRQGAPQDAKPPSPTATATATNATDAQGAAGTSPTTPTPTVRPRAATLAPAPAVKANPAPVIKPKAATPTTVVRVAVPAPTVRPAAPAPTVRPAPAPAPVGYVAPTVTFNGSTCREDSTYWTITWSWTATGGHYVDLGSGQARTNVTVNGGTRTWTFNTTESGFGGVKGAAPTTSDAHLSRITAPIGQSSDVTAWKNISRTLNEVPVQCG